MEESSKTPRSPEEIATDALIQRIPASNQHEMEEEDAARMVQMLQDDIREQVAQENAHDPPNNSGSIAEDLDQSDVDARVVRPTVEASGDWDSSDDVIFIRSDVVRHDRSRHETHIDEELLDEGIRRLRWKDYSADSKLNPDELDELKPGFDPNRDMLAIVVPFGGSWEEYEGDGDVESVTEIHLSEDEDINSAPLNMAEGGESSERPDKGKRKASDAEDLDQSDIDARVVPPTVEASGDWDSSDDVIFIRSDVVRPHRSRHETHIDEELLDEGIRRLRWKDYSTDSKLNPDELDELKPGIDPNRDMLAIVVPFGGSWEEHEGEEDDVVSVMEIYLSEDEDINSAPLNMAEEGESSERPDKGKGRENKRKVSDADGSDKKKHKKDEE